MTRAYAVTLEQHRADYAQLLNSVPAVRQLSWISSQGRELLRLSRTTVTVSARRGFFPRFAFYRDPDQGRQLRPGLIPRLRADDVDLGVAFRFQCRRHRGRHRPRFLSDFLGDAEVGKATFAYVVDPRGRVLASSAKGPEIGKDLSALPQVAAVMRRTTQALASGTDADGHSVLTAASAVPKLGWLVFFEQPTAQALAPIRDQLLRIALLIALGLRGRDPRRHRCWRAAC